LFFFFDGGGTERGDWGGPGGGGKFQRPGVAGLLAGTGGGGQKKKPPWAFCHQTKAGARAEEYWIRAQLGVATHTKRVEGGVCFSETCAGPGGGDPRRGAAKHRLRLGGVLWGGQVLGIDYLGVRTPVGAGSFQRQPPGGGPPRTPKTGAGGGQLVGVGGGRGQGGAPGGGVWGGWGGGKSELLGSIGGVAVGRWGGGPQPVAGRWNGVRGNPAKKSLGGNGGGGVVIPGLVSCWGGFSLGANGFRGGE